jgi:hypothetical protein
MGDRLSPPSVLLPHTCIFSGCRCRCSRICVRLPPPRVLLPHTYTQDGWFLQPKHRPAWLPRRTVFSGCICRCSRIHVRLPPPTSSSLTHKLKIDGFYNQNTDQIGSLSGLSFLAVYVGVVEYTTSSPTHTPPLHTGFPMIAHLSRI